VSEALLASATGVYPTSHRASSGRGVNLSRCYRQGGRVCAAQEQRDGEDRDLGGCLPVIQLAHQREERRQQVSHEGSEEEYSADAGRAWADLLQDLHSGIMHAGVTDGGGT